jgi:hypothetical protein
LSGFDTNNFLHQRKKSNQSANGVIVSVGAVPAVSTKTQDVDTAAVLATDVSCGESTQPRQPSDRSPTNVKSALNHVSVLFVSCFLLWIHQKVL